MPTMTPPTVADVAREAGVGVATVDRVINQRAPVRPDTAERVLVAAEKLGFHRTGLIRKRLSEQAGRKRLGFVLQNRASPFYRELGRELAGAAKAASAVAGAELLHLDDLAPARISAALLDLATRVDAIGLVAADHPQIAAAIDTVSSRGVPVFALVSDLPSAAIAGYVGIDHRKVGRSAAWAMSRLCREPGPIGLILGSHRYLCQEQCEVSFRSYLREFAPAFTVLETLVSLENTELAQQATLELLHRHSDLVGVYVAGGGIEGVLQGLASQQRPQLVTVCHDLTEITRQALLDGLATVVLSHPRDWIAVRLVQDMLDALADDAPKGKVQTLLPFTTCTAASV
jgi:LacI family transcriptional regulator